ncbi:retrovirus-related pol polyprotein from transposon TNT 1-94 [Tanacetum coccineum]
MNENENLFILVSMGYDQEMVPKNKDWVERLNPNSKLPNFNTGRILVPKSQAVNESLKPTKTLNTPESSKDSKAEFITLLPPLKNLQGTLPSSEVIPLTFQPYSPKERPGLGIMKHKKSKTHDYSKCVSKIITGSETKQTTSSVPTKVKDTEQESNLNELTKLVQMLIDEKVNSNQKTQESTSKIQKTESSKLVDSSRMSQDSKSKVQNIGSSKSLRPKPIQKPQLKCELCHYNNHSTDDCYRIFYCMICKREDHRTSDHEMYIALLKIIIAPNEPEIPHTNDDEGPPDLINTKETHEQNVQNDQMITQPTDVPSGNNTKVLGSITEPLVPYVTQSYISNHASTSSHLAPRDRWSRDQHIKLVNIIGNLGKGMLTRRMATKLTAASASECLFANFLSKIEPKKVSEALKHPGWIDVLQEELNQFYRHKLWTLVPLLHGKIAIVRKKGLTMMKPLHQKEEVYVKQPPSFESSEFPDYVCKLDKALYGLKQAPKAWNLLKKYEISDSSLVKTPMVPPNNLGPDLAGKSVNETSYRGMIGSLMCCASILWMKSQLNDYDIYYKMVPIFCDNTSTIAISNNLVLHSRTKHIDIRYHFIKDHILKGDIELHFIPTKYQLADIFTKPLDEPTFTRLKAELGMLNID